MPARAAARPAMPAPLYAFPFVGRAGLGNLLFPWAQAEVFSRDRGVPMLAPQWAQPRLGSYLRREKEKRLYMRLFRNDPSYVSGLRKYLIVWRARVVDAREFDAFAASGELERETRPVAVKFWRYEQWFAGLEPHRDFILRRLWAITAPRIKRILAETPADFDVAVHVRRGDKPPFSYGRPFPAGETHFSIPDEWFIRVIESVRASIGRDARVRVFSDAHHGQIDRILSLPGVTRAPDNPPLVDMYLMARAKVIVPTAKSSFSAWSQFIGGMPAVWFEHAADRFIAGRPDLCLEADRFGDLPADSRTALAAAAARPARIDGVGV